MKSLTCSARHFLIVELRYLIGHFVISAIQCICIILPHGNINDSLTDKLLTKYQCGENLRVSERAERASLEIFRIYKYPNSYIFQYLSWYLRIIWHVSRLLCCIYTFNAVSLSYIVCPRKKLQSDFPHQ